MKTSSQINMQVGGVTTVTTSWIKYGVQALVQGFTHFYPRIPEK